MRIDEYDDSIIIHLDDLALYVRKKEKFASDPPLDGHEKVLIKMAQEITRLGGEVERLKQSQRDVVLTGKEIVDLAEFAGFEITKQTAECEDYLETELAVKQCPKNGIIDCDENDTRKAYHSRYITYFYEYPEEGCINIGEVKEQLREVGDE